VLLSIVLTCVVALAVSTMALVVGGHRWRRVESPVASLVAVTAVSILTGELTARFLRLPTRYIVLAQVVLVVVGVVVVSVRRAWNPVGHVFLSSLWSASVAYLAFAGYVTVAGGLSAAGLLASAGLWLLEAAALVIAGSFAFESCDVICRTSWRPVNPPEPAYQPMVSVQVPAYNEPPEMLIETIQSLEALDYPNFEIVVIDNNTTDEEVWRPVEAYCAGRERVRFVHVSPWPGYKSGALNLVLREYTDPAAELVAVVDADYIVRPDYLRATVGYFADPRLAFLQTPQDYREYEGDTYLTACYDAYRYFFETAMPSRNERNSIIFGGTMGLIRRSVLEELGGWDEWCITEDAETSLRILRAGYDGLYLNESFGQGIMPLTFTALKRQRFRWAFGGIQILRKHWRSLVPWDRAADNHLTLVQRRDYLVGGLQWFVDLVGLGFTAVLGVTGMLLLDHGEVGLLPLVGAAVLLPVVLCGSGVLRAVWALRQRRGISTLRALLAFANWLALSWTTALACVQGLVRRQGVFLRTPKWRGGARLVEALRETRVETALAAALWSLGAGLIAAGHANPGLIGLFAWQGAVYAAAPFMAWLNHRTELSARLARRQRSEERRERLSVIAPRAALAGVGASSLAVIAFLAVAGGAQPSARQAQLFQAPQRAPEDHGPLANVAASHSPPTTVQTTTSSSTTTTRAPAAGRAGPRSSTTPTSAPISPKNTSTTISTGPAPTVAAPPTTALPSGSTSTSTTTTSPGRSSPPGPSTTTTTLSSPTSTTTTTHPSATTSSTGPPTSVGPPTTRPSHP
jgi:glycosyltransferase involved in cell wall biosynthesis